MPERTNVHGLRAPAAKAELSRAKKTAHHLTGECCRTLTNKDAVASLFHRSKQCSEELNTLRSGDSGPKDKTCEAKVRDCADVSFHPGTGCGFRIPGKVRRDSWLRVCWALRHD